MITYNELRNTLNDLVLALTDCKFNLSGDPKKAIERFNAEFDKACDVLNEIDLETEEANERQEQVN
jgi:hypothetical protein